MIIVEMNTYCGAMRINCGPGGTCRSVGLKHWCTCELPYTGTPPHCTGTPYTMYRTYTVSQQRATVCTMRTLFFPITYMYAQYVYVVLPYAKRTLTSLYDENKPCVSYLQPI